MPTVGNQQTAAAEEDPFPPVKVVLYPAAEPKPALKYRLLPGVLDRKPGNAAVVYGKVKAENEAFFSDTKLWEKVDDYAQKAPLADLRKEKGPWRQELTQEGIAFYYLDWAARCQFCDWQYPIGEPGQLIYSILMPETQQTRTFARLLAARARLQIADGHYDEAIHTFQTGFAMSKHVGESPLLVGWLIGVLCSELMWDQVLEFIQQPDAPNLYWALADLPRPLIALRPTLETEMEAVYLSWPELRDLEHKGPRWREWKNSGDPGIRELGRREDSPQEWQHLMEKAIYRLDGLSDAALQTSPLGFRLIVLGHTLRLYPQAKQFLVARGHTAAEVEAMPVPKVVLLYTMALHDDIRDDTFKWFNLPYPEAAAGLEAADKRLKDAHARKTEIIPFAATFFPAMSVVNTTRGRLERSFEMLRVLEALRLYGAAHNRLPDKLSDIEVPIPMDPASAKPFIYRRSGDTAWLEAPPPAGANPPSLGTWRYDIRFVPKGKQP
jgi:hypothetical protein